jgi:uncharacterized membrane protein HdeD (DUF308 family)
VPEHKAPIDRGDWAIGLLVGIDLMFYGITALALARLLKRVAA